MLCPDVGAYGLGLTVCMSAAHLTCCNYCGPYLPPSVRDSETQEPINQTFWIWVQVQVQNLD